MPYEGEHSCRLKNPVKRAKTRRVNNDRKHDGKPYDVIYQMQNNKWVEQAYRYPTKNWTASAAKSHCKSHKGILFEPAKSEEKQSFEEPQAPIKACIFNSSLTFAEAEERPGFSIIGYSGKIIKDHWFWGDVAFDLNGLKFAKKPTPILEEHFTSRRIGFSTKQEITDKVTVEGLFLENDNAAAMARDLKAGFPMEASLYVPPSVVEKVEKGASVEVNGQTLHGPGAVFRKAQIKEVSMCVFGADSNTQSMAYTDNDKTQVKFNLIKEKSIMADEQLTIETFAELHPEIYKEIFEKARAERIEAGKSEAQKLAAQWFAELKKVCGEDTELLVEFVEKQTSIEDAKAAKMAKLEATNKEQAEQIKKLSEKKVDPAVAEFNDTAPDPKATEKFDEAAATDEQLKEHYNKDKNLQDEFHSVEAYLAYIAKDVRKGD